MTVHISYFAVLREQRGLDRETMETNAKSYRAIYDSLGLKLPGNLVTVAVGGDFKSMEDAPQEGDQIVFIPPVAGG